MTTPQTESQLLRSTLQSVLPHLYNPAALYLAQEALSRPIASAEPVARFNWGKGGFEWLTKYSFDKHNMKPLYLHPDPGHVATEEGQGLPNAGFSKVDREPDWSNSKTSPMEIWKNRVNTLADRLEMADGAISFRDEVIANLRAQLAEARSDQKPIAAQPCRSPYCECELGKCSHPGFYDARHMPCEGST